MIGCYGIDTRALNPFLKFMNSFYHVVLVVCRLKGMTANVIKELALKEA